MRFPCSFNRYYGTIPDGEIAMNADSAPTSPPSKSQSNVLHSRPFNYQGWPAQRIAVAYTYEGATNPAPDLTADLYFWEDSQEAWFKLNQSSVTLTSGEISYFDVVTAIEGALTNNRLDGNSSSVGALEVCLVAKHGGTPDAGIYKFSMAADMSSSL